ncbi:hypothetical protein O9993_06850 [Vibrio lentus]|nr:hypothetical protein [Vibrio lentus]
MVWVGFVFINRYRFGLLGALVVNVDGAPVICRYQVVCGVSGLILGWLRSVHPTLSSAGDTMVYELCRLNIFVHLLLVFLPVHKLCCERP